MNQILSRTSSFTCKQIPCVAHAACPFLSFEGLSHHGVKPLLANSGLKAIPALGELMLPPCGLRPSLGFIQVRLMLCWGNPV
jgi:hypothetical protein